MFIACGDREGGWANVVERLRTCQVIRILGVTLTVSAITMMKLTVTPTWYYFRICAPVTSDVGYSSEIRKYSADAITEQARAQTYQCLFS